MLRSTSPDLRRCHGSSVRTTPQDIRIAISVGIKVRYATCGGTYTAYANETCVEYAADIIQISLKLFVTPCARHDENITKLTTSTAAHH